jgi:hypothetical protein
MFIGVYNSIVRIRCPAEVCFAEMMALTAPFVEQSPTPEVSMVAFPDLSQGHEDVDDRVYYDLILTDMFPVILLGLGLWPNQVHEALGIFGWPMSDE